MINKNHERVRNALCNRKARIMKWKGWKIWARQGKKREMRGENNSKSIAEKNYRFPKMCNIASVRSKWILSAIFLIPWGIISGKQEMFPFRKWRFDMAGRKCFHFIFVSSSQLYLSVLTAHECFGISTAEPCRSVILFKNS